MGRQLCRAAVVPRVRAGSARADRGRKVLLWCVCVCLYVCVYVYIYIYICIYIIHV